MSAGRRRLGVLLALAALIAGGVGVLAYVANALRSLELTTVDTRFSIRGEHKPRADLVIVGIDRKTLNELPEPAPFGHDVHASILKRLERDGAKVVAFDLEFSTPRGRQDAALAFVQEIERAGNVVTASSDVDNGNANAFTYVVPDSVLESRKPGAVADWLRRNVRVQVAYPGLPPDPGGVLRRVRFETEGVPAFSLAVAAEASGRSVSALTPRRQTGWVDFYGPPGTVREIPYSDVRLNRTPPGTFKDKIVIVGNTAPVLQDTQQTATSGDGVMSGPEIQANAVGTALAGFPLRDSARGVDLLLILMLGAVAPAASLALRPLRALTVAVLAGVLYAVLVQLAFGAGLILSFVYPILALAVGAAGASVIHYVREAFERQRTRDAFARFVPPSVVDEALREAGGVRLGGVGREATVLFSDLRGFTSFAEETDPEDVINILNRYLTCMVNEAISPHGGTLVVYMGDGIMAVFGAPVAMDDHADRALAASRDMLGELDEFNEWMQREYGFDKVFRMGIGLNTGRVMSGMVGSEERLAYTVIGDTANTASRLEAKTKGTSYMIFLSEETKESLSAEPEDLVFVEEVPVRGRQQTVKVWTVEESCRDSRGDSFESKDPAAVAAVREGEDSPTS